VTIFYPDIASFQKGIDLAGALCVVAKATEGTGYVNPEYGTFHDEAARHGTVFAAYHFLSAGNGTGQAAHCHAVAGKTPTMLDFEPTPTSRPGLGDAVAFTDAYRAAGGVLHLVYLPHWYWQELGSPSLAPLTARKLQLVSSNYAAGYTDAPSGAGWQGYGGMNPAIWQYSSTTPFSRMSVDFNAFRGSKYGGKQDAASIAACLAEFRSLLTTGTFDAIKPGPAPDAYRQLIGPGDKRSLWEYAARRNVDPGALISFSLTHLSPANDAILNAYLALNRALKAQTRPHPVMPEGLVLWTHKP
jgi:hypothetical protein